MKTDDAIIALATPDGRGAIAVFRISGRGLKRLLSDILPLDKIEPRLLKKVLLRDDNGDILDEITFVYYAEPKSYTGEDVIEIFTHGGVANSKRILNFFVKRGLRIAEPGEFTFRALFNGKLSLSKAESIDSICKAENIVELNSAIQGLSGRSDECFRKIYNLFLEIYADIVNEVEFVENDPNLLVYKDSIMELNHSVDELIDSYESIRGCFDGVDIVIAGRSNVGKSSLFNRLIDEERSIVTEIEGTTRDVVDRRVYIGNLPVRFADTAGLRETADKVELIGQKRTAEEIKKATLLLYMIDVEKGLNESDKRVLSENRDRVILVVNKIDLDPEFSLNWDGSIFYISAKFNQGIDGLMGGIRNFLMNRIDWDARSLIFNKRQYDIFLNIRAALERVLDVIERGDVMDILLFELREVKNYFESLLGYKMDEDIYRSIFSRFCIGK